MKALFYTSKYTGKILSECELELSKLKKYNYPDNLKSQKLKSIYEKLELIRSKKTNLYARTRVVNLFISNEIKSIRKNKDIYEECFKKTERKFKVLSWILYLSAISIINKYYLDNLAFNAKIIHEIKSHNGMSYFSSSYGTLLSICFLVFYSWYFLKLANIFFSIKISIMLMHIFKYIKYRTIFFINMKIFSKLLMSLLLLNFFAFIPFVAIVTSFWNYIYK